MLIITPKQLFVCEEFYHVNFHARNEVLWQKYGAESRYSGPAVIYNACDAGWYSGEPPNSLNFVFREYYYNDIQFDNQKGLNSYLYKKNGSI